MNKYTVIHTIRFSEQQAESLQKLKDYEHSTLSDARWNYELYKFLNTLQHE